MTPHHHYRLAKRVAHLLDDGFHFGRFSFGLDPIIDLLPGGGDFITALISLYLVYVGVLFKLPPSELLKMFRNIIVDFLVGLIPIVGDAADFMYKSNLMNLKILEQYIPEKIVEGEVL